MIVWLKKNGEILAYICFRILLIRYIPLILIGYNYRISTSYGKNFRRFPGADPSRFLRPETDRIKFHRIFKKLQLKPF